MINTKAVSVIIPFHNSTEYMRDCIENMIHQTIGIDKLELIFVDDASDDDGRTVEVLKEYEAQYPDSIKLICLETNMRQGGARNVGLMYATGEYVAYCDSDDWMADNALEIAYNIAVSQDCDEVEFDFIHGMEKKRLGIISEKDIIGNIEYINIDSVEKRKEWFMSGIIQPCTNKIFRRSMLVENNIVFAEHIINEEVPFTLTTAFYVKKFCKLNVPMYYYYRHSDSSTLSNGYIGYIDDVLESYDVFYDECIVHGLMNEYKAEIDFTYWSGYFLLPMLVMAGKQQFFTRQQLEKMQQHVRNRMKSIKDNRYFKEKFAVCPMLGDLAFVDLSEIDISQIADTLKEIAVEV